MTSVINSISWAQGVVLIGATILAAKRYCPHLYQKIDSLLNDAKLSLMKYFYSDIKQDQTSALIVSLDRAWYRARNASIHIIYDPSRDDLIIPPQYVNNPYARATQRELDRLRERLMLSPRFT